MKTCSVVECGKRILARGWCAMHYARWRIHGDTSTVKIRTDGEGYLKNGYIMHESGGLAKFAHVRVAERAFGKQLPYGVIVHHVDEDRLNNANTNLVICSRAYHRLLHQRMNAFAASGHADWRKCKHCQQYDLVSNLCINRGGTYHPACRVIYQRARLQRKKETS